MILEYFVQKMFVSVRYMYMYNLCLVLLMYGKVSFSGGPFFQILKLTDKVIAQSVREWSEMQTTWIQNNTQVALKRKS